MRRLRGELEAKKSHDMRHLVLLWPLCAALEPCDARPTSVEVEKWCARSCTMLLAFLRMRASFEAPKWG